MSDRALESVRGPTFVGELRLAITDYVLPSLIADLLKTLRVRYPHLRLSPRFTQSIQRVQSMSEYQRF
ncbi:substrate-binding domain-containing protein [Pseudomonas mohnii]|uniref:substrate-binding domain-containing protein n=1 Tax=Pseudomonas sp. MIL9 TaxID=2807620 RepID=UPI001CB8AC99|nr:substrate-binding domain-containing protein [Pseudomonas sp. MIL9]